MTSGWFNESKRHSLARKGIKTGRKIRREPLPDSLQDRFKEFDAFGFEKDPFDTEREQMEAIREGQREFELASQEAIDSAKMDEIFAVAKNTWDGLEPEEANEVLEDLFKGFTPNEMEEMANEMLRQDDVHISELPVTTWDGLPRNVQELLTDELLKDSDGDGVVDIKDCNPTNPEEQDLKAVVQIPKKGFEESRDAFGELVTPVSKFTSKARDVAEKVGGFIKKEAKHLTEAEKKAFPKQKRFVKRKLAELGEAEFGRPIDPETGKELPSRFQKQARAVGEFAKEIFTIPREEPRPVRPTTISGDRILSPELIQRCKDLQVRGQLNGQRREREKDPFGRGFFDF